jgi:hypothetical protein
MTFVVADAEEVGVQRHVDPSTLPTLALTSTCAPSGSLALYEAVTSVPTVAEAGGEETEMVGGWFVHVLPPLVVRSSAQYMVMPPAGLVIMPLPVSVHVRVPPKWLIVTAAPTALTPRASTAAITAIFSIFVIIILLVRGMCVTKAQAGKGRAGQLFILTAFDATVNKK